MTVSRRVVLGAAASLAAVQARAEGKGAVVVGTWGGDYARLLHKNIEEPILVPAGWDVIQDIGDQSVRKAKMIAERRLPRGSSDVQGLSGTDMYLMSDVGVVQEIDYGRLANAKSLLSGMKFPYGVGHIYSGMVNLYNPAHLGEIGSYKAMFDPKLGNKLGVIDIQYQYNLVAASLAAGGTVSDVEPGKRLLLELKQAGVRVYPTNEAFAQGLKTEEISAGIMWKARAVQWQNAGIGVKAATPAEGALAYVSGFVIPKNAPHLEGAYAYLDAMLARSAQEAFAVDMGYNPTVGDAVVAPDLRARIGFTPAEEQRLVPLDNRFLTEKDAELKEWWDKSFKG